MKKIGLFGGTFDPIHIGHLQMALEAKAALALDELRLIPCHQPYHREQAPSLSAQQRLQLLQLAVDDAEGLIIDDRELKRSGPSYTIDTLLELRQAFGDECSMVLLMGMDAYQHFHRWHRAQDIVRCAHIVVITRPGYDKSMAASLSEFDEQHLANIDRQPAGQRLLLPLTAIDVSATAIRQQLAQHQLPNTLPAPVADFIRQHRLYGYGED